MGAAALWWGDGAVGWEGEVVASLWLAVVEASWWWQEVMAGEWLEVAAGELWEAEEGCGVELWEVEAGDG